jgi:GT2 family glycosyltransferase
MNKISIVIPIFNKWNFTKSCLDDLGKLPLDTHEIIVIDNGSSDETRRAIHDDKYDFVRYTRNDENLGFAKACNIGYSLSSGNVVMFLNNDIRVKSNHNNWTNIILDTLSENKNSLVGPTGGMVDPKNNFQFMYETGDEKKKVNYMSGWCLSAYKDQFKKLIINRYEGPFSEEFGIAYFEDTDLSFRANRLGMEFKFVDIPVIHFGKITSSQINTHKLYSEARKIFIEKWNK